MNLCCCVGTLFPRFTVSVAYSSPVEDQIDVLGEAVDQAVDFGKTRAAFESK